MNPKKCTLVNLAILLGLLYNISVKLFKFACRKLVFAWIKKHMHKK